MQTPTRNRATVKPARVRFLQTRPSLLTVYILQDEDRFMAKCTELDLVTEMDNREDALDAMIEMLGEYAQDYRTRMKQFTSSPNRAHHKPYIETILTCKSKWELLEIINVKYGHIQLQSVA